MTPPTGTPVCLIENTSDMRWGGVVRSNRKELAGVMGPYPMPTSTAPIAAQGRLPTHSSPMPTELISKDA